MWQLSAAHGSVVPPDEFLLAVRLRLGAPCVEAGTQCCRCGAALGPTLTHAHCCALPEATKGHYNVRDAVLPLAHLADSSTAVEAPGLIPSAPALRPTDLLVSAAIPGRLAALDIGIISPDAAHAGDDCCQAMFARKKGDYLLWLSELESQGIVCLPMI